MRVNTLLPTMLGLLTINTEGTLGRDNSAGDWTSPSISSPPPPPP